MEFKIGKKNIGDKFPVFIIAELSANHKQKFSLAVKTIEAAKRAGADAIKLQTYTADTITLNVKNKYFKINGGTLWDGRTLYDLYKEAYTPWEWQPKLKKIANNLGMECFSSPFDISSVDFLQKMKVPAYKIASFEINDIPLIEYVASKGKPIIISTGIATLKDIQEAIKACKRVGNHKIAILKCTSAYPAPIEQANLRTIPDISKRFKVIAGLSDHTNGIIGPVAATTLGANIIEKHLIINRKIGGPDAKFSLEPNEFKDMVNAIRDTEKSLGKITYSLTEKIKKSKKFSRSLFVTQDISKDEILTNKNIRSIRPNYGLPPKYLKKVLGKKANRKIKKGTPLSWNLLKK